MKVKTFKEINFEIMQKGIEFVEHCDKLHEHLDELDKVRRELTAGKFCKEDFEELSFALNTLGKTKYPRTSFSIGSEKITVCIHKFGSVWDVVLYDSGTWGLL